MKCLSGYCSMVTYWNAVTPRCLYRYLRVLMYADILQTLFPSNQFSPLSVQARPPAHLLPRMTFCMHTQPDTRTSPNFKKQAWNFCRLFWCVLRDDLMVQTIFARCCGCFWLEGLKEAAGQLVARGKEGTWNYMNMYTGMHAMVHSKPSACKCFLCSMPLLTVALLFNQQLLCSAGNLQIVVIFFFFVYLTRKSTLFSLVAT